MRSKPDLPLINKLAFVVFLLLVLIPTYYMVFRNIPEATIFLSGQKPRNYLVIGVFTGSLFIIIGFAFRKLLSRYIQLIPVCILLMCYYLLFFGGTLYDDFYEHRTFSATSSFHNENVVIIGTRMGHTKSGPHYSAVLLLPKLRDPHPLVPIMPELYEAIRSRLQSNVGAGKDIGGCLLSVVVQQAGYAKRIIYQRAFKMGDLTRC